MVIAALIQFSHRILPRRAPPPGDEIGVPSGCNTTPGCLFPQSQISAGGVWSKKINTKELRRKQDRSNLIARATRSLTVPPTPSMPLADLSPDSIRKTVIDSLCYTMLRINRAEHTETSGVWYPDDYARTHHHDQQSLYGITNGTYFDIKNRWEFRAHPNCKADEALFAFLNGLTLADCGNVVQACVYQSLLDLLGSERFNQIFSGPISPLTITQLLFQDDTQCGLSVHGNPLMDLFETPEGTQFVALNDLDILEPGDICHIKGIENYPSKHPAGAGQGWNLICIGENEQGKKIFVGFGPKSFKEPRTFEEIRQILIAEYNKPQTQADLECLRKKSTSSDLWLLTQSTLGPLLANHQVNDDSEIGGLYAIVRPRFDLIYKLARGESLTHNWFDLPVPEHPPQSAGRSVVPDDPIHNKIPVENRANLFDNYTPQNQQQRTLKETAQRFVSHALDPKRDYPLGLMLQGVPGIGKTHIASAIANDCVAHGLKVNFINRDGLGVAYNLEGKRLGDFPGPDFFDRYVEAFDVIILDDMNDKYGIEQFMIKAALDAALRHNKAIVITCNAETGNVINERLYHSWNILKNPYAFLKTVGNLDGESQRKPWWKTNPLQEHVDKNQAKNKYTELIGQEAALSLSALMAYEGAAGAGIMVPGHSLTAAALAGGLTAMGVSGVYLVPSCYDENGKWRNLEDLGKAKVIVIEINDDLYSPKYNQFTKVAMHAHERGQKLIVVTEKPAANFFADYFKKLEISNSHIFPRTRARLAVLFREFDAVYFS